MPNHVTTVCTVSGDPESVSAFVARHIVKDEKGEDRFDFETVIRKPECVDKTESGTEADAGFFALTGLHHVKFARFCETPMHAAAQHSGFPLEMLTTVDQYREWLEKTSPESIKKGRAQLTCFRETGYLNWYDWDIANWGTEWNAYSFSARSSEPNKYVFEFQTAWSVPEPIFQALGALWATLTFDLASIDEGGPEYEGRYTNTSERLERMPDDDARYRLVYGRERPKYDDDGDEIESAEAN